VGDSIFPPDTTIRVTAYISDPGVIRSVAASVVGDIFLEFESQLPMDTSFTIQYPIPVDRAVRGRIQILIVASDTSLNIARVARPFVIR
jgi:hypothetical protein